MHKLPSYLADRYEELQEKIRQRLQQFKAVPESEYFYELCFCLCTSQSKAKNALIVQNELKRRNYFNKPFDASELLRRPENYIRFHNIKAKNIREALTKFEEINKIIKSEMQPSNIRNILADYVTGLGMKEASHFLRNIGFTNLAIIDRHILKHLVRCGIYSKIPMVAGRKNYLGVESKFFKFADEVNVPVDEMDLLFWSYETGEILK